MEPVSGGLYLAVLFLSATVCGFMAYLAFRHRERRGAFSFGVLVVCLFVWALTEATVLAAGGEATMRLVEQVQFVAVPFVPVAMLVMALRYTGHESYISRTTLGLLLIVPGMSVLVMLTNPYHGLFWESGRVVTSGGFSMLALENGPWYYIHLLYSYLLLVLGTATLVRWALNAERTYRRQARYILIGVAVPWAANVAKQVAIGNSALDPTPVFFTVTGVFVGVAILRFQFLDLAPVARNTVVEVMREGLLVVDTEGRIVDANPAAETLLDEESLVGSDIRVVAPASLARACLEDREQETLTLPTPIGERTFDIRWSTLPGGARMMLLYDVTERRRQAEQLERQNDRLERFGSVLSHDLRNPLNVAEGYVEMVARDAEGQQAEHAHRALDGLERIEELIDKTLAVTREGPAVTDPEPVDVEAVAREAWRSVETAGASLELAVDRSVMGDPDRVQRLFENLFRNSTEHAAADGRSEASNGETPVDLTVRVDSCRNGFAVADDGPGIPEDERESVLEFGFTTAEEGTGLGLSIVTEIAEAHGWRVEVGESDAGGARFAFLGVEQATEGKRLNESRAQSNT
jgi:signal transduction histidine kinase